VNIKYLLKRLPKKKSIQDSYIGILATFIVAVATAVTISAGLIRGIGHLYSQTYGKDRIIQKKIDSISVGQNISYISSIFGPPIISNLINDTQYTEHTFKMEGGWMEAVTGSDNTAELITFTSCSQSFTPLIRDSVIAKPIRLGASTMDNAVSVYNGGENGSLSVRPLLPTRVSYFVSLATGPSATIDEYYLANPGNYLTLYTGFTDTCRGDKGRSKDLVALDEWAYQNPDILTNAEALNLQDEDLKRFRKNQTINTVMIAMQKFDLEKIYGIPTGISYSKIRLLPK